MATFIDDTASAKTPQPPVSLDIFVRAEKVDLSQYSDCYLVVSIVDDAGTYVSIHYSHFVLLNLSLTLHVVSKHYRKEN